MLSLFVHRWVLSPLETIADEDGAQTTRLIVADYCLKDPLVPKHLEGGLSLCYCEMTRNQWQAAQQDTRLVVLESLHSNKPIHPRVAEALAVHGVKTYHTTHDALCALYQTHGDLGFVPEI